MLILMWMFVGFVAWLLLFKLAGWPQGIQEYFISFCALFFSIILGPLSFIWIAAIIFRE